MFRCWFFLRNGLLNSTHLLFSISLTHLSCRFLPWNVLLIFVFVYFLAGQHFGPWKAKCWLFVHLCCQCLMFTQLLRTAIWLVFIWKWRNGDKFILPSLSWLMEDFSSPKTKARICSSSLYIIASSLWFDHHVLRVVRGDWITPHKI